MVDTSKHVRFLGKSDIEGAVKKLISQAARARVAVAYWGKGSSDWFDIEGIASRDVTIVCDLMSGACNPGEIEQLQKALGKPRVLTRDHLHAKVWLTDTGAIVGSSNASANGLGFEGDELKGLIEANVFVDDAETLTAINRWFEKDVMEGAREITKSDFKEAHRLWQRRRAARPLRSPGKSILDVITTSPSSFAERDFMVYVYKHDGFSRWALANLKAAQKKRPNTPIDGWENIDGPMPQAGAFVLDFNLGEDGKAKLDDLYQVLRDDPLIKGQDRTLLLCRPVRTFKGLPLGDKKRWERAATAAAKSKPNRDEWGIVDFSRQFLKPTA